MSVLMEKVRAQVRGPTAQPGLSCDGVTPWPLFQQSEALSLVLLTGPGPAQLWWQVLWVSGEGRYLRASNSLVLAAFCSALTSAIQGATTGMERRGEAT